MTVTHALALLAVIAGSCAVAAFARARAMAPPVALVLVGLAASYLPGVPEFRLNPQFFLLAVLPPLVYTSALGSSYLSLRDNVRTLALLSVGLVLFTAFAVAGAATLVVPAMPLAVAFTLGAVLAPTDAVTTASIGRRLHLPHRLLVVITGESMLNDGTALTLYAVAAAAASGAAAAVAPLPVAGRFLAVSAAGVAVGLVLGFALHAARMRLSDPLAESALSLMAPFAAYLVAEAVGGSGILAVVVAGLYLGHHSGRAHFATRLQTMVVWRVASFVLEAVTFTLIGLQLRPVIGHLAGRDPAGLLAQAGVVLAVVVAARIVWVFPAIHLPRWLIPRVARLDPAPSWRTTAVLSWAGLRGVISLAAAAALPDTVPGRDLLVFLTFAVVLGTLLVQGLTLGPLIRRLGVLAGPQEEQAGLLAQAAAQKEASGAGIARLEELARAGRAPPEMVDELRRVAIDAQVGAWEQAGLPATPGGPGGEPRPEVFRRLRLAMTSAERETFIRLRDERKIGDEELRTLLRGVDLEEAMLAREEWDTGG